MSLDEKKNIDKRDSLKVITSNEFILARELSSMSLKARKLLYITIAQCRKGDTGFFEYSISIPEFAEMMGIAATNVYQEAFSITKELAGASITILPKGGKRFEHYPLTARCRYDEDSCLIIQLNPAMTDLLLNLRGSFTQPLLHDFIKMRSPYSMALWHLMQKEMHSRKPGPEDCIEFEISLKELREVTGTQEKLRQIGEFKSRVLDKALREIRDNCGVTITYENIKESRTIKGFRFKAISKYHINQAKIKPETIEKAAAYERKRKSREMTDPEKAEYDRLTEGAEQLSLDDYF